MPDIEAAVTYLLDEAAIRDAIVRFADTATLADIDGFRALWADDGEWHIGTPFEQHAQGVGDIVSMCQNLWKGNDYFVQFAVPGPIQVNGDEATARSMCHEAARGPNGRFYRNNGVWHDRLRRTGKGWVFTNRTYQYLWLDLAPFTGDTFMSFPQ